MFLLQMGVQIFYKGIQYLTLSSTEATIETLKDIGEVYDNLLLTNENIIVLIQQN